MKIFLPLICLIFLVFSPGEPASCAPKKQAELVMAKGMEIIAETPEGKIRIKAKSKMTREYIWQGGKRTVKMSPQAQSFNGGIYNPSWYGNPVSDVISVATMAFGITPPPPKPSDGIIHGISVEQPLNFASCEEALMWIFEEPGAVPYIWRNDGLCVWYNHQPNVITVEVYQIYINGKKPENFPGGKNNLIKIVGDRTIPNTINKPVVKIEEKYRKCGNRDC